MEPSIMTSKYSILIINPNTSKHMTDALKPIVNSLNYTDVHVDYFTAPDKPTVTETGKFVQGIPSINSNEDSSLSALHCLPHLKPLVGQYDAFLVACYSAHPLVGLLKDAIKSYQAKQTCDKTRGRRKHVIGILEASISTCLGLTSHFSLNSTAGLDSSVSGSTSFGIISTGDGWKKDLTWAVRRMILREKEDSRLPLDTFAGVETTGLTAIELHSMPVEEVRSRIKEATERLINSASQPVTAICLGCGGMAGMEESIREGCVQSLGERMGSQVAIVDGVLAGFGILVNACKSGF